MKIFKKLIATIVLFASTLSIIAISETYAAYQLSRNQSLTLEIQFKVDKKETIIFERKQDSIVTSTLTTETEDEVEGEIVEEYLTIEEVINQMSWSMDLGKPCGLSKEDFVELMENLPYDKSGFYERNAEFIWKMEQEYQVNAIFYCGIVAQESQWATYSGAQATNNYTGMMCSTGGLICYETEEEGIEAKFKCLSSETYILSGRNTVSSIGSVHAEDSNWASKVYGAMIMILNSSSDK